MVTAEEFILRFPEFDDLDFYPIPRIEMFINDTLIHMGSDETRWCGKYDYAQAYLAAHLLTSGSNTEYGDTSTSTGPISSKSADGVSVGRAVATKDRSEADDFYMGTSYGQRFITVRDSCLVGVLTAFGNY